MPLLSRSKLMADRTFASPFGAEILDSFIIKQTIYGFLIGVRIWYS